MNAPKLKPAILLLSFAALVTMLVIQRRRLHAARLEHADLLIAASKAPAQPATASRILERAELDRLRREQDELVRLRAKRDEMNRKEAGFRATVIPPPPVPMPEGTVRPLSVWLALADLPTADRSTPMFTEPNHSGSMRLALSALRGLVITAPELALARSSAANICGRFVC